MYRYIVNQGCMRQSTYYGSSIAVMLYDIVFRRHKAPNVPNMFTIMLTKFTIKTRNEWRSMSTHRCGSVPIIMVLYWAALGGTVASWLVRSSPERAVWVSSPGRGCCVVFLGKTPNSHSASLHPHYQL